MAATPFMTVGAVVGDPDEWYMTVEGVLSSDTYSLYPYLEHSLDIGFSQFGEMISYDWSEDVGTGLQYHGYEDVGTHDQRVVTEDNDDVFANELVAIQWWMNGWFLDLRYTTPAGDAREIWAYALFSDSKVPGKDWITMPEVEGDDDARPLWQRDPPYANPDADAYSPSLGSAYKGGRKTNGACLTYPIEVLYDGPRKFIALTRTKIMDAETPLLEVHITIVFDKVEKSVILLKDVKMLYTKGPINVQFGNRGEWDLLPNSFVHFYTDEPVQYWDLDDDGDINITEMDASEEYFSQWMVDNKYPKKWWQDVGYPYNDGSQVPDTILGEALDYTIERVPGWWETQPTTYSSEWHVDPNIKEHGYAVAQIIHTDYEHVGAVAVWPHPEFWSVQNRIRVGTEDIPLMLTPISRLLEWNEWTEQSDTDHDLEDMPNVWVKLDDMTWPLTEPSIPFIIYEHDFELRYGDVDQYRIVSVYTLTDLHDGDDADIGPTHSNVIDKEIQYQLDEIFSSWDLRKAFNKETKRWAEYFYYDDFELYGDYLIQVSLPDEIETEYGLWEESLPVVNGLERRMVPIAGSDFIDGEPWDAYCSFSERVELDVGDGFFLVLPYEATQGWEHDDWKNWPWYYEIDRENGVIHIYNDDDSDWELSEDDVVKVLWSSWHYTTKAKQWLLEEVGPDQADALELDLEHIVADWPREEVLLVDLEESYPPQLLNRGDYVYDADDDVVYLDKQVRERWFWSRDPYVPELQSWLFWQDINKYNFTVHANDADDQGTSNGLPYNFMSEFDVYGEGYELTGLWIGHLYELYVDPDPTYVQGNVTYLESILGYVVVDVKRLTSDNPVFLEYGDLVEIDYVRPYYSLSEGDYIIHETDDCDELVVDEDVLLDPWWDELKIVYKAYNGRWEWTIVGKEAETVDSVGAALITAAIKNKNMEIGIAGTDIMYSELANQIPWVMAKYGAGYTKEDYHYDHAEGDHRTALKNDWCASLQLDGVQRGWPISTSNMIGVGGPLANLLAYYGNDFMQAIYGDERFSGDRWEGSVVGYTCWRSVFGRAFPPATANIYSSDDNTRYGYAVLATTKDKNSTVIMNVWGHYGRDTFWASRWVEWKKFWLNHINPHVTAIILKIDYKYPSHPSFTPVEFLGTISEKYPHQDNPTS